MAAPMIGWASTTLHIFTMTTRNWRPGLHSFFRSYTLMQPAINEDVTNNVLRRVGSHVRRFSSPPQRKSFLGQFIENIRQDMTKNKEMKESLRKFREEADKLEQSESLQNARKRYQTLESETVKGSAVIKEQLENLRDKLQETLEEAQNSELGKKASQISSELSKSAKEAAEAVSEKTESLGRTAAFKTISKGVKAVKQEIDESEMISSGVYKPPVKLRRRVERQTTNHEVVTPNEEATGIELHKDSKWFQSWQTFKDNNEYVNKVFQWKVKYDESDNPLVRASKAVTDKVSDIIGGMFQKTELSEVLTEICKMDPTFDKESFLKECETEIIPNILEALVRGELAVLKDWCHEAPYNVLATPIKEAKSKGYQMASRVLDIGNVDLSMGKMMEQGPVLIISFHTQQIMVLRNMQGNVVEGDPDKVVKVFYVWALCRDQMELDPKAAWKLMDLSASTSKQWL